MSVLLEPGQHSGYMVFPLGRRRGFARLSVGRSGQDGAGNEEKDGADRLYDKSRCGGRTKNGGERRKSCGLLRKSGGLPAESPPLFASPSACATAWRATVRSALSRGNSSCGRFQFTGPCGLQSPTLGVSELCDFLDRHTAQGEKVAQRG